MSINLDFFDRNVSNDFRNLFRGSFRPLKEKTKNIDSQIDLHKVGQAVMLFVAFGIVPALTYGTALGTLESERTAIMSEIDSLNLQAQIIRARTVRESAISPSIPSIVYVYEDGSRSE